MSIRKKMITKKSRKAIRNWRIDLCASPAHRTLGRKISRYALEVLRYLEDRSLLGRGRLSKCLKDPAIDRLSIVLINDRKMRILNRSYRGKDKPTDVLSFSMLEGENSSIVPDSLGDLVISLETARRQARQFGVTYKEELHRLIIHGILHLCGYDHERVSNAEAERMRRLERKILNRDL